jgi:hypothetical protein
MRTDMQNAGFARMVELLVGMLDTARAKDNEKLVRLSNCALEELESLVGVLYEDAGVKDEDIELNTVSQEEVDGLVKIASHLPEMPVNDVEKAKKEAEKPL